MGLIAELLVEVIWNEIVCRIYERYGLVWAIAAIILPLAGVILLAWAVIRILTA